VARKLLNALATIRILVEHMGESDLDSYTRDVIAYLVIEDVDVF